MHGHRTKQFNGVRKAFFSLLSLEKYYLCYLPLPFIATILGKVSNNIANSHER